MPTVHTFNKIKFISESQFLITTTIISIEIRAVEYHPCE